MIRDSLDVRVTRVLDVHRQLVDRGFVAVSQAASPAGGVHWLPEPPTLPPMPLNSALQERRSHYEFADMAELQLSALLRSAAGPSRTVERPTRPPHTFRANPTAGGLDSMDLHLVVLRRTGDIDPGTYLFDPPRHVLTCTGAGACIDPLQKCLLQPQFAHEARIVMVLAGRLDRTLIKYTERHYRTLHIDAGVALQNLYLVATALGMACCAISGFYDEQLSQLLRLDRMSVPLVAFAVGGLDENRKQR